MLGLSGLRPSLRSIMSTKPNIPGYEILEQIGAGGMSTVWKARQLSLDRLVAIKTLLPEYLPDETAWQRFRMEARTTASLNHPVLVQVFDAGVAEGIPYLVLEYVEGRPLGDVLAEKGRLEEAEALRIVELIAQALNYAWDKDCIVHCDVKPDNILLREDGSVKLVDLGLARLIGLKRDRSASGDLIIGTPNYASPEQAEGLPDLDCRADIYSLGATLYHLVTGRVPFEGSPGSSAMDRQITDFLPDPVEVAPNLRPQTAWLIEKMMVKNRAYRPAFWSIVLRDIAEVRAGRMPSPPLPEPGQSTVARSSKRIEIPVEKKPATPAKATLAGVAAQKQKKMVKPGARTIRPSGTVSTPNYERVMSSSSGLPKALFQLLALITVGAIVYAFFLSDLPQRIRLRSSVTPSESETVADSGKTAGIQRPSPRVATAPKAAAEPEVDFDMTLEPEEDVRWPDETFKRGARAFNEAIELYAEYQKTRSNPAVLAKIEQLAREAINAFETSKSGAPDESAVQQHINSAYRLISDVRQSTLMDQAETASPSRPASPPSATASAASPPAMASSPASGSPAERAGPWPEAGRSGGSALSLTISPIWNKMPLGNRVIWEDLREVLKDHAQPSVDLRADGELKIFRGVTYLMPAAEAAKVLGVSLGSRIALNAPGFPDRSFSFYSIKGDFGNGFEELVLITDMADRVAAVQLGRDRPDIISLEPKAYSPRWRTYNFVHGRVKSRRYMQVGHRVTVSGGIVQIFSEQADLDPLVAGRGRCEGRAALLLPQSVANLIMARLETAK